MTSRAYVKILSLIITIVLVLFMPVLLSHNEYLVSVLILIIINTLMVSSLRQITLIRELSLGHVGFSLIGAYCSALLMMRMQLPFWPAMLMSGLFSAGIALILAYPFLRVKGIYFSVLTLLTAETIRILAFYWKKLTGGNMGLVGIPSPDSLSLPLLGAVSFDQASAYYYLTVIIFSICYITLYLIERSHLGFTWRAVRDGEELSLSVGINVTGYKIINFVTACFFAGIAGSLFAHYQHNLSADFSSRFGVVTSIYLLVYMVVGGRNNFFGPAIGTVVLTIISELTRPMKEYQPMIIGAIAILVILFFPKGLAGLPDLARMRGPRFRRIIKDG